MLLKIFKYDMKSVSWNLGLLHLSLFVLILVAHLFENIIPFLSNLLYFIFLKASLFHVEAATLLHPVLLQ